MPPYGEQPGWALKYSLIFAISFVFASVLAAVTILLCRRFRLLCRPAATGEGKPIPMVGGVAIWLAMTATLGLTCVNVWGSLSILTILYGAAFVLLIGVWNDAGEKHPAVAMVGVALAAVFMAAQGIRIGLFEWPVVNWIVTVLWVLGVVSAFSVLDRMDGLGAGLAFIVACMFAFCGAQSNQFPFTVMSLAVAGASLGFMILNRPPARIHLGRSGALVLGYTVAALAVLGMWSSHPAKAVLIPVLILSVPLCDLVHVALTRSSPGGAGLLSAFIEPGRDRLADRLMDIGFRPIDAVLFILAMSLGVGIVGVVLWISPPTESMLLGVCAAIMYALFFALIAKAREHAAKRGKA